MILGVASSPWEVKASRLDDEEGLADGAAAVEEDRDGAVRGVVREQEVALGG